MPPKRPPVPRAHLGAMLLLFDIDGTLLDTGGAGLKALRSGLLEEFELADRAAEFPALDLAGATDSGVVRFLFDHFAIPRSEENVERFFACYLRHLETGLGCSSPERGRLMPGIDRLMTRLGDHHAVLGLLTGNIARGAWTKVASYGLEGFFAFGAFGDDHHDRNQLGPVAIARAREFAGRDFEPHLVFIIGDTPRDILCARACGAWAVAVATGRFTRQELAEHEPDLLFDTLEDTEHFVSRIEGLAASE